MHAPVEKAAWFPPWLWLTQRFAFLNMQLHDLQPTNLPIVCISLCNQEANGKIDQAQVTLNEKEPLKSAKIHHFKCLGTLSLFSSKEVYSTAEQIHNISASFKIGLFLPHKDMRGWNKTALVRAQRRDEFILKRVFAGQTYTGMIMRFIQFTEDKFDPRGRKVTWIPLSYLVLK